MNKRLGFGVLGTIVVASTLLLASAPKAVFQSNFDGAYTSRIFPEINISTDFEPFYCDQPYTKAKCPIPLAWNPPDISGGVMKRPEFKPSDVGNRVRSGKAQQFFSFFGVSRAGVFVRIPTEPGKSYKAEFYGQIWDTDDLGDKVQGCWVRNIRNECTQRNPLSFTSDIASEDDRTTAFMYIAVDQSCNTDAFAPTNLKSKDFGYYDGLYDKYSLVSFEFTATGPCSTVFLGAYNRYAKVHNNFYYDDFTLYETGTSLPTSTPAPTGACVPQIITATPGFCVPSAGTPTPEKTLVVTPLGPTPNVPYRKESGFYEVTVPTLYVRPLPVANGMIAGAKHLGDILNVQCIYKAGNGDEWVSELPCYTMNQTWLAWHLSSYPPYLKKR